MDPTTQAPTNGNPANPAPGTSQASAPNATTTQPANPTPPAQGQASGAQHDDILRASQFELSPAEKVARLERDYSASSQEARRLKSANDALTKTLAEQGLKPVFDGKGNFKGLETDEKYEGKAPDIEIDFKKLPKDIRDKLTDDPEGALSDIAALVRERVGKSLVRAKATIEPSAKIEPVSAERIAAEVNFLADRKMPESDVPRYEFNNQTLNTVKAVAESMAQQNPAFARFLSEDPSTAIQFAADRVAHSQSRWSVVAQKLAQQKTATDDKAKAAAALTPGGSSTTTVAPGGSKSAATAEYIKGYESLIGKPLTS